MPKRKHHDLAAEARRRNLQQLARAGSEIRDARLRRRMTQQQLADAAGISRSAEGRIERGEGGGHTLDTWQRVALAAGRPLVVRLERDPADDVADAGHLAIQELILRLGRKAGATGSFELATRPSEPWRSTDVGIRDDRRRLLALFECWNSFGDLGAAARSSTRKTVEVNAHAIAIGEGRPYVVASCWVVRDTRRNRALVQRYPEVFRSRFPGSSRAWVEYLTAGRGASIDMPILAGAPAMIWCDLAATRVFAMRHR